MNLFGITFLENQAKPDSFGAFFQKTPRILHIKIPSRAVGIITSHPSESPGETLQKKYRLPGLSALKMDSVDLE